MSMHQQPMTMTRCNMIRATHDADNIVSAWMERAKAVSSDDRFDDRMKRHECKACFYGSKVGFAAVTKRPCMCCGKDQSYGSSYADALCMECAVEHGLCKHCGGDLAIRTRRRNWPEPKQVQQ